MFKKDKKEAKKEAKEEVIQEAKEEMKGEVTEEKKGIKGVDKFPPLPNGRSSNRPH